MRKQVEVVVPKEVENRYPSKEEIAKAEAAYASPEALAEAKENGTFKVMTENFVCREDWGKVLRINTMSAYDASKLKSRTEIRRHEEGALALMDEWLSCVEIQTPSGWVKLLPRDHIAETATFSWLYFEVFDAHTGFTRPEAL